MILSESGEWVMADQPEDAAYADGTPEPETAAMPTMAPQLDVVYIRPSGSKFHTMNCDYADGAKAVNMEDALAQGYEPCSVCIGEEAYQQYIDGKIE